MTETRSTASRGGRLGLVSAACSALIGLVLLWSESRLVSLSYDTTFETFFWRREDRPTTNAIIVYMDKESHERLAQPWDKPWNRAWHARLIDRLSALGARVIAFDLLFEGASEPAADAQLVDAASRFSNVVVAAVVDPVFLQGQSVGGAVGEATRRAFPGLAAVTTSGVVEQLKEDSIIRRHYFDPNQTNSFSLAWVTAARAGYQPSVPTGGRWVNYYGPPVYLPWRSYWEIFETNQTADLTAAISNRVVFVGARSLVGFTGGKTDDFRTPYSARSGGRSPGVEINATTFLNLVRRDWLTRLPAVLESILVFLAGWLLGLGLWKLRPHWAALVAVLIMPVFVASMMAAAWSAGVWFPWCVVVLAQLPVALAFSVLGQSRQLAREKRAFEQALALTSEGRGTTTSANTPAGAPTGGVSTSPSPGSPRPMILPDFLREPLVPPPSSREELPRVPDHELIRCIGRGGYGEVWLSRDILGSCHAVKLLRLRDFSSATPLQTEFDGLKQFTPISRSHPGLLHILHVGRDESRACLYYVMELADDDATPAAPSADDYVPRTLARDLNRRGHLSLVEVVELGIALAEALHHLHTQGLVHRDIKPANIVYVKGRPKLADVGLVTTAATHANGSLFLGTPGRIAPEGAGTPGADVFSLGKVLYEAGLGMDLARFPELPANMIQSGADRNLFEFNRIIMRACDVDPGRRWATAGDLAHALRQLRERLPASGPEAHPKNRPAPRV